MKRLTTAFAVAVVAAIAVVPAASAKPISDITAGYGIIVSGVSPVLTVAVDPSVIQVRVSGVCASGYAIQSVAGDGGVSCVPVGWSLSGNAGTTPGANFVGTTDNQPLVLKVNGRRALRLEPTSGGPNLIGGDATNSAAAGKEQETIGGGAYNTVIESFGTIGGGQVNTAGYDAVVAGGSNNNASGPHAAIGGGVYNTASGSDWSTVAGGGQNTASGLISTVLGGSYNTASGDYATVAGGSPNEASGDRSFAAGSWAQAAHDGAFVWSDASLGVAFGSTAANEFSARATGGVRFVTAIDGSGAPTAGVQVAPGNGSWSSLSDRTLKRNFLHVDRGWLLERLAGLPISTWSYKAQKPSIRHLGPTAQDFARAFGLGEDDRHIDSIDSEGVSLAGIQALYRLVQAQQRELDTLKGELAKLRRSRARGSR